MPQVSRSSHDQRPRFGARACQYAVYIYSPTGDLLQSFTPFNDQLGVKAVRVSSLSMVALGSYDEQVRAACLTLAAGSPP